MNLVFYLSILVKTVDEFQGMNPKDVVLYIEGDPFISVVPVEPGLTNTATEIIMTFGVYSRFGCA